jgi:hypothetical protein
VELAGTLKVNLTKVAMSNFRKVIRNNKPIWELEYKIRVMLGTKDGVLRFTSLDLNDEEIGSTEIVY